MAGKERIIKKIVAEIDWYIIERVRELRRPKFSQNALSIEMGFAEGFIGRIENPNYSAAYSPRHLNLIAKALKVKVSELLPSQPLPNDLVRLVVKIHPATKLKKGEKNYEIIEKIPLREDEIRDYNNKKLNRPTKSGQPPRLKKRISLKGKK